MRLCSITLAVLVWACLAAGQSAHADADRLAGPWRVEILPGQPLPAGFTVQFFVPLADRTSVVVRYCNTQGGSFELSGEQFSVAWQGGATLLACRDKPNSNELEMAVTGRLERARFIQFQGRDAIVLDSNRQPLLRLTR